MTSQEPIGAGKPVFIEHEQKQEGNAVTLPIVFLNGKELEDASMHWSNPNAAGDDPRAYIRADIAEQMAEALREVMLEVIPNVEVLDEAEQAACNEAHAALAAYEQAKAEEAA